MKSVAKEPLYKAIFVVQARNVREFDVCDSLGDPVQHWTETEIMFLQPWPRSWTVPVAFGSR